MYGLICENVSSFIKHKYGDETWDSIRRLANIDSPTFSVHKERFHLWEPQSYFLCPLCCVTVNILQVYPEQLIGRMTKKALSTIDMTDAEFFEQVGLFFVEFVSQFG